MIPGLRAEIFDYLDAHCDGLVIESFGAGGLPNYENDAFCARLAHFLSLGKTAVLTTQVEREEALSTNTPSAGVCAHAAAFWRRAA